MSNTDGSKRKYIKLFESFVEELEKDKEIMKFVTERFIATDDSDFQDIETDKYSEDIDHDEPHDTVHGEYLIPFNFETEDKMQMECGIGGQYTINWFQTAAYDPGNYFNEPSGPDGTYDVEIDNINHFMAYKDNEEVLGYSGNQHIEMIHKRLEELDMEDVVLMKIKELVKSKIIR